jgi:hypothetical protein
MSENACDGYHSNSSMMEIPGSPSSISSVDSWSSSSSSSSSTTTAECVSQPLSPSDFFDDAPLSSIKKPLKPSLKRIGTTPRVKRNVSWDPSVVFETRPFTGKRRGRAQVEDGDDEVEKEMMNGNFDAELKAPIPTKRAKLCEEIESPTFHQFSSSMTASTSASLQFLPSICPPLFPEASRTVIPSFNFSSFVARDFNAQSPSETQQQTEQRPSKPCFLPFSLVNSKRKQPTLSNLIKH